MPRFLDSATLERLQTERHVWLAAVRPDGSPHVTPVWYVFRDEVFWICSQVANRKVALIAQAPRVAVAIEGAAHPVVAEGTATVRYDFPHVIVTDFVEKYEWEIGDLEGKGSLLLEIKVDRWLLAGTAQ